METIVREHGGGRLMRKRKRPVEFDRERKQTFLDHFAGSCNLEAAARTAGIGVSSVYSALANDGAFAEGFQAALEIGYRLLEAEALGQQRAAQQRYSINPAKNPKAEAQSFERTMQLLAEYHRGQGRIGRRPTDRRHKRVATNAEVREALVTRLAAFRQRIRARTAAEGRRLLGAPGQDKAGESG